MLLLECCNTLDDDAPLNHLPRWAFLAIPEAVEMHPAAAGHWSWGSPFTQIHCSSPECNNSNVAETSLPPKEAFYDSLSHKPCLREKVIAIVTELLELLSENFLLRQQTETA